MSLMYMAAAFKTKVGNPLRKLVLIKLADNANDDGVCWPSYAHIADQAEISRRSVITHCSALEAMGLISITERPGEKGNSSNVFKLHIEKIIRGAGDSLGGGAGDSLGVVKEPHPEPTTIEPVNLINDHFEKSFEIFWLAFPTKKNKKGAKLKFISTFKRLCKEQGKKVNQETCKKWTQMLVADIEKRLQVKQMGFDQMHATTYLNQERWHDEISNGGFTSNPAQNAHLTAANQIREHYRGQGFDC